MTRYYIVASSSFEQKPVLKKYKSYFHAANNFNKTGRPAGTKVDLCVVEEKEGKPFVTVLMSIRPN